MTAAEHLAAAIELVAADARAAAGHPVHRDSLSDALDAVVGQLTSAAANLARVNGRLVRADL